MIFLLFQKAEKFREILKKIQNVINLTLLGGWSNIGPTMLVEALDSRSQKWVRSELKLFELPRAYHAVINTGEYLFTIGGFNGAEYYRSTRRFSLTNQVDFVNPVFQVENCSRLILTKGR